MDVSAIEDGESVPVIFAEAFFDIGVVEIERIALLRLLLAIETGTAVSGDDERRDEQRDYDQGNFAAQ